jgi:hypothetical protein
MLPTPTARDPRDYIIERAKHRPEATDTLSRALTILLPTPTAGDGTKASSNPETSARRVAEGRQPFLTDVVQTDLLPTPAVNDMGDGKTLEWWEEWAPRQKSADGRPAPHGKSLAIEALRMLRTPTSQAAKHGETPDTTAASFGHNLWDLPTILSGENTAPPLPDGLTPSDDQRQRPLSQDLRDDPDSLPLLWTG